MKLSPENPSRSQDERVARERADVDLLLSVVSDIDVSDARDSESFAAQHMEEAARDVIRGFDPDALLRATMRCLFLKESGSLFSEEAERDEDAYLKRIELVEGHFLRVLVSHLMAQGMFTRLSPDGQFLLLQSDLLSRADILRYFHDVRLPSASSFRLSCFVGTLSGLSPEYNREFFGLLEQLQNLLHPSTNDASFDKQEHSFSFQDPKEIRESAVMEEEIRQAMTKCFDELIRRDRAHPSEKQKQDICEALIQSVDFWPEISIPYLEYVVETCLDKPTILKPLAHYLGLLVDAERGSVRQRPLRFDALEEQILEACSNSNKDDRRREEEDEHFVV